VADGDLAYLSGLSEHPNRAGDVSNFNPAFASPLANAIRQARAAGLPVGIASGFRKAGQTGSAYDAGGNSSHTYGLASDISGLDGPNGKITNQWAQIAQANGLHNPYGVGDKAEFNHWQLPLQPLEQTPQLLASLKQAKATGNMQSVWAAAPPLTGGTAVASAPPSRPVTPTPGPTLFAGLNPAARGMRNNNPGNLEANDWTSKLPGYQGSDGRFAIFDTPQHGAAALDQNLAGYGSKGVNTPLAIASRWAPDSDNNDPNSYGAQIAKSLGVGLNDKVDMSDPATRNKITQAIGLVENGAGNSAGVRVAYGGSAPIGTTLNTPPAPASIASALAGIGAQASDKNFTQSAQALDKAWHGDQTGGGEQSGQGAAFNFMPARNVSPLLPMARQVYGNTLTSMETPLQWGAQSPGQAPYANTGGQPVGQQFGTSLASLQQMRQQMAMMGSPYGNPFGDSSYG
jgi:hypothetical protein